MQDARHFRLLGRRADLVKLAGRRASLAELNRILIGIDGVLDGQFVAPDDLDRRPTARLLVFVVAPERSADEIMADLRGQIDPPFLPRRVIRVAELPRNEVGKLTEQALGVLQARLNEA
jgi:acyl-coenzyme A synthetase/AMP-(fatty) acid ligase